jgi:5'-nucleotidase
MICNDDGYDSEGIGILFEAAKQISDDVWLVAPATNQSARSRAYSIARDVRVQQLDARRYTVEGTPVDCAIIGLNGLLPGRRPDLVLSGVNEGTNLAEDIPTSGTIGVCLEAVDQGVPAIAFSQIGTYKAVEGGSWLASQFLLPLLLPKLVTNLKPEVPMLNVNFPQLNSGEDLKGIKVTHSGRRTEAVHVQKRKGDKMGESIYYFDLLRDDLPRDPEGDIHFALDGYVTITPLASDLTNTTGLGRINLI